MTTTEYDLTTARAVCNDQSADTWEVQAMRDGDWWTVSDSSRMAAHEAEALAESMRATE